MTDIDSLLELLSNEATPDLICLNTASPEQVAELKRIGFNFDILRECSDPTLRTPEYYYEIAKELNEEIKLTVDYDQLNSQKKIHIGLPTYRDSLWQQVVIENGYAYTRCPLSGRALKSNHSFNICMDGHLYLLYFFEGVEPFFLLSGLAFGFEHGFYFPNHNLCVQYYNYPVEYPSNKTVDQFKLLVRDNKRIVLDYLRFYGSRKTTLLSGHTANMAHHVWQELSGLDFLDEIGKLINIDYFVLGRYDYFNLNSLFKTMEKDKIIRINNSQEMLFRITLMMNSVACVSMHPTIKSSLRNKIIQTAYKFASKEALSNEIKLKQKFPVIWFGIRSIYRKWDNQIVGLSSVINSLYKEFPNMAVIIDGWSKIPGYDDLPLHVSADGVRDPNDMNLKEQQIIDEITRRISPGVLTISLLNQITYDKVIIANSSNYFICPLGSSDTYVSRISNKFGIIHTNSMFGNYAQLEISVWGDTDRIKVISCPVTKVHSNSLLIHHSDYSLDSNFLFNEIISSLKILLSNSEL